MQQTREIDIFWTLIAGTVDELVGCLEGLGESELN